MSRNLLIARPRFPTLVLLIVVMLLKFSSLFKNSPFTRLGRSWYVDWYATSRKALSLFSFTMTKKTFDDIRIILITSINFILVESCTSSNECPFSVMGCKILPQIFLRVSQVYLKFLEEDCPVGYKEVSGFLSRSVHLEDQSIRWCIQFSGSLQGKILSFQVDF